MIGMCSLLQCSISSITSLFAFTDEIPVRRHQINDNYVRRSTFKICKKFCEKCEKKKVGEYCMQSKKIFLNTEFDHIPVHIFSTRGNFDLIVVLALLFKWGE